MSLWQNSLTSFGRSGAAHSVRPRSTGFERNKLCIRPCWRRTHACSRPKQISETFRFLDGSIDSGRQIHAVVVVINGQNLLAI